MKSIELFFSYSHKDDELRDELLKHLSLLKREHVIAGWHDREIGAGQGDEAIRSHLDNADIILLLISSDFMASDYCYDIEVKRAMKRHEAGEARVIPVILRPVDWKRAPFGKLAALPKDGKPVKSWSNPDDAFLNIAEGVRKAVEDLLRPQRDLLKDQVARLFSCHRPQSIELPEEKTRNGIQSSVFFKVPAVHGFLLASTWKGGLDFQRIRDFDVRLLTPILSSE